MTKRSDRRRQERAAELWHAEQEWRAATRCSELLAVETDISDRKWRLFALACCRDVLALCPEPWHREAFEQTELVVDGPNPAAPCRGNSQLWDTYNWSRRWGAWDVWYVRPHSHHSLQSPGEMAAERALIDLALWLEGKRSRHQIFQNVLLALASGDSAEAVQEREAHDVRFTDLLHEIVGDPFGWIDFDPSWRTSNATCLARIIYATQDYSLMPILADALQDAGCEISDILDHCRTPGAHVRGCWVVDLVLGKP